MRFLKSQLPLTFPLSLFFLILHSKRLTSKNVPSISPTNLLIKKAQLFTLVSDPSCASVLRTVPSSLIKFNPLHSSPLPSHAASQQSVKNLINSYFLFLFQFIFSSSSSLRIKINSSFKGEFVIAGLVIVNLYVQLKGHESKRN